MAECNTSHQGSFGKPAENNRNNPPRYLARPTMAIMNNDGKYLIRVIAEMRSLLSESKRSQINITEGIPFKKCELRCFYSTAILLKLISGKTVPFLTKLFKKFQKY